MSIKGDHCYSRPARRET